MKQANKSNMQNVDKL